MPELLRTFEDPVADSVGHTYYVVRACARAGEGGLWEGWLEFVPSDGSPVLRSQRETTQPNLADAQYWADGLTKVYTEGSLGRTLDPISPIRTVPKGRPTYDGPAPSRFSGASNPPILEPYAVFREGGSGMLRRRLSVLADRHLRHIALYYRMIDPRREDLDSLWGMVLIERILEVVAAEPAPPVAEAARHPAATSK